MPNPAIALLNPHAAGGAAGRLQGHLTELLHQRAPGVSLHVLPSVARARQLLREQAAGTRVLLLGGDGSLHPLLDEFVARGHELALLPFGSGNDSARALGLGTRLNAGLIDHALHAPVRPMDLGEARTASETRLFASSLAAGFDAAVAARALSGPKWLTGMPRYLLATLHELLALRVQPVFIEVDGQAVHEGPALFASALNTATYGGGMKVAPQARVDDGRLDLVVVGRIGRAGALLMLPRLLLGRHVGHRLVALHSAQEVSLSAPTPLPLAADGEPMAASTSVKLRLRPGALLAVRG